MRFWDLRSGLCVKTLKSNRVGEVSSVWLSDSANMLLVCSRDNANRLWDIRKTQPLMTFKGHQNTSANFVRATFGPSDTTVIGGSEDGRVYVWETATGVLLQRLEGHEAVVYDVAWNARAHMLASCSLDGTVRLWVPSRWAPTPADDSGQAEAGRGSDGADAQASSAPGR